MTMYLAMQSISLPNKLFNFYAIPDPADVLARPLRAFYEGYAPVWYDIFNHRIFKTSHYKKSDKLNQLRQ